MGEMVLAGAFASWYWTFDKDNTPSLPLLSSIGRYEKVMLYHRVCNAKDIDQNF